MPILGTVSSGYVELPYALSQTFNASGNYTVPAGKTKIAIVGCGGGGGGAAGSPSGGVKAGGAGGGVFSIREITTTPGTVYSVTVGAAGNGAASVGAYSNPGNGNSGGSTVFGSILTATGGQGGTGTAPGEYTSGGNAYRWINRTNAQTSNNSYASLSYSDVSLVPQSATTSLSSQTTNYFAITGLSSTIPSGATVNGITVKIESFKNHGCVGIMM
jgi:hypothetical protein